MKAKALDRPALDFSSVTADGDTQKAFKMINKNGIILWHDYVPGKTSAKDVVKLINEISREKKIYNIKDTSLCYFKNEI